MNVLVISQYYFPEQLRITDICETLVKNGHNVTVVTGIPNYPEGEIFDGYENSYRTPEIHNGVKILRCNNRPRHKGILNLVLNYLSFVKCANRIVAKLEDHYDIVYVYQLSPVTLAISAIKYKKKNHVPLYLYCLDIWPESVKSYSSDKVLSENNIVYKVAKYISMKVYENADRIGVSSRSFKSYLMEIHHIQEEKIHYLPQHSDDIGLNEDLTAENNDCIDIFFMGNVGVSQNTNQIVDAVEIIKSIENFKIHIVGSGSMLEEMKKRVTEKGVEQKFVFYGKKPYADMPKYYKMADACLLTLNGQTKVGLTIPGKLQNYMAAGKPVIASIDGDASDVIHEANCGICVEADNVKALAKAISEFVIHNDKYAECGMNARKYFEKYFMIDAHIKCLENEIQRLTSI